MANLASLSPTASDIAYIPTESPAISLICRADSYKFGHAFAYPDGILGMTSYGCARIPASETVVPFGLQMVLKKYFTQQITAADIDAAETFSEFHFGRKLFSRESWERVVSTYDGYLPLIIRAVPEGKPVRGGQPLYTVTCIDPDLAWMSAYFETLIQRGVWYPTTIATMGRAIRSRIEHFYDISGADMNLLPFALHDFGARGVTSSEQAEIGGAAHTVNFMGSDNIEGILTANSAYNCPMSAFSVFATEHSIQCSFGGGKDDARRYISKVLEQAKPGAIVSIVLDGYDVYREAELLCTEFRDQIIASGAKVVFRPDSGDMMDVVPRILAMQARAFGVTKTDKGYDRINCVGVIQGDGVDHQSIISLLGKVVNVFGYSADVVIFGSGGALLQKVNRDTLKFAQKASAILVDVDGVPTWKGIAKDPITDAGKKSAEGLLTVVENMETGVLSTFRLDLSDVPENCVDVHKLVYHTGTLYNQLTLAEVRRNAA